MNTLTHLSLFTGIGGIDLAAEWAGIKTVGQCEWADYPTKVLEKHWPDLPRWKDVRELTAVSFRKRTGLESVSIISGGFPCQPHSLAGKRKASTDERDLWPEYRRVISEIKPRWVVAENVRGLLTSEDGRFFRGILRDFADMGYDVGWCIISAASAGAVHRRERMAIIAHSNSAAVLTMGISKFENERQKDTEEWLKNWNIINLDYGDVAPSKWRDEKGNSQPIICRENYGVSSAMDRLKCLGNAVVPQQFYPVFKAISEIERS